MYSPHVSPDRGSKWRYSMEAHSIFVFANPVESIPSTRYVNGLTLYMKIQKPGSVLGPARTPQKINVKLKSRLAIFPAVSAVSIPAIMACVKVLANIKKAQTSRNIKAPRSWTCPSGIAFRYIPIG